LAGQLTREALYAILSWANDADVPLILETPGRDVSQRLQDIAVVSGFQQLVKVDA
jgi:endonuclease IV